LVSAWADIGNKAAHGEFDEYSESDVRAMLDGVENIVADRF
jgi:cell division septum initiation protein DivIVA